MRTSRPRLPPVVVVAATAGLMWLLARGFPDAGFRMPARVWAAAVAAIVGLAIAALGVGRFVRAKTTVNPMEPANATTLVTGGIYTVTRNPMYLGLLLLLVGWAILLANGLAVLGLPLFVLFMNRWQIGLEEMAMTERFGAAYDEYRRRVRRWL